MGNASSKDPAVPRPDSDYTLWGFVRSNSRRKREDRGTMTAQNRQDRIGTIIGTIVAVLVVAGFAAFILALIVWLWKAVLAA